MNKLKTDKKAVVLSLALAAGLLLPMGVSAQTGGGVFFRGDNAENASNSMMNRGNSGNNGLSLQGFGENQNGLSLQNFGEPEAPLGNGWIVLVTVGLGYVAKQTRKNKKETKQMI